MAKDDKIFRAALSLPQETRAELADRLLESLDESDQDEIDRRWTREAEDRIAAFERGEIHAIPGDEIFSSLKFRREALRPRARSIGSFLILWHGLGFRRTFGVAV